jgi:hypothetical protein
MSDQWASPDQDVRRLAYRRVANWISLKLAEEQDLPPRERVQLERIAEAMRSASSVDPK